MLENLSELLIPYPDEPRNALFFDYGAPSLAVDLYIKWRRHVLMGRKGSDPDLTFHAYDQPQIREKAARYGISLRYERIIANLLRKQRLVSPLSSDEERQLLALFELNREFSPHFPLRPAVG